MNTVIGRFLSFDETMGKGLVKFAYFVLLTLFVIAALIAMIGGIVRMFDDFLAGLWQLVSAPFELLIAVILLRVGAEVVLAILSIDDQLTDGARGEGRMPSLGRGGSEGGSGDASSLKPSVKTPLRSGETEASRDENQKAPFTQGGDKPSVPGGPSSSADDTSPGYAASKTTVAEAPGEKPKPAAKKVTKKAAPKPDTSKADASKADASKAGASKAGASETSASSTKSTVEAAKNSPASARSSGSPSDEEKG